MLSDDLGKTEGAPEGAGGAKSLLLLRWSWVSL